MYTKYIQKGKSGHLYIQVLSLAHSSKNEKGREIYRQGDRERASRDPSSLWLQARHLFLFIHPMRGMEKLK